MYTPIMIFALIGIPLLWKYVKKTFFPVLLITLLAIYVISSWWSWWYGCSFSQRPFVDYYALLSIPMGVFYHAFWSMRSKIKVLLIPVVVFLIFLNLFQTWQVRNGLIHQISMTRKSYFLNFLKTKPHPKYEELLVVPDYLDARKGIYYSENEITDGERQKRLNEALKTREDSINYFKHVIKEDVRYYNLLREKAKQRNIPVEEMIEKDAVWLYEQERYGIEEVDQKKYANPKNREDSINAFKNHIRRDVNYMKLIHKKAKERNISVEEMIEKDAIWLYEHERQKRHVTGGSESEILKNKEDSIDYYKRHIINDTAYYELVRKKAKQRNISVDSMIELDAIWLYKNAKK